METTRQKILNNVATELMNIQTSNGYNIDLKEVRKGMYGNASINNYPTAVIQFGVDLNENQIEGYHYGQSTIDLSILVYLNSSSKNLGTQIENVIADLYKFFNRDESISSEYVSTLADIEYVQDYVISETAPNLEGANNSTAVGILLKINYINFIDGTVIPTPDVPSLTSPVNNFTEGEVFQSFDWASATNATSYEFQLSTDDGFNTIVIYQRNIGTTSYTVPEDLELTNGETYFWRVRSRNVDKFSEWSSIWSFVVNEVVLPDAPVLVSPVSIDVTDSFTVDFIWEVSNRSNSYDFQLSDAPDFSNLLVDNNLTQTTYEYTFASNSSYYWRVRGKNTLGTSDWSEASFATNVILTPEAPTLVSPLASTETTATIDFVWDISNRSTSYDFQIASDSGFNTLIVDTNLTKTTYEHTFTSNGTYYWRVRGKNTDGTSDWSGSSVTIDAVFSKTPIEVGLSDIWVRGDDITLASGAVSSWNDKSGNARHLTNSTAGNRPITETIGGKTFVKFEGTLTDVRNLSIVDSGHVFKLTGTQVRTFAMVIKLGANTTGRFNAILARSNNGVGNEYDFRLPTNFGSSPSINYFAFPKSDGSYTDIVMPDNQGTVHLLILEVNGTSCKIYLDGILIATRTVTFGTTVLPANASTFFVLGGSRQPNASQGTFNGSIGEFSSGAVVLTDLQKEQLLKYYTEYYG
jgi:hypothetical protein